MDNQCLIYQWKDTGRKLAGHLQNSSVCLLTSKKINNSIQHFIDGQLLGYRAAGLNIPCLRVAP